MKKGVMMPSQTHLNEILLYNQETGSLHWRVRNPEQFEPTESKTSAQICNWWNVNFANKEAGFIDDEGYSIVGIDGKYYKAHRLIFTIMGEPLLAHEEVDHSNGVRHDNRWKNLKRCSRAESRQNLKKYKNNTSGVPGVYISKDGRKKPYRPFLSVDGKKMFKDEKGILKSCETLDEAIQRRDEAKKYYHTFCPTQRDEDIGMSERSEKRGNSRRSHKTNNLPIGIYRVKYGRMGDYKYRVAVPGGTHVQQWIGYRDTLEEAEKLQTDYLEGKITIERKEKALPSGVTKIGNRFKATVYKNNNQEHLGYFDTPEDASQAIQHYK